MLTTFWKTASVTVATWFGVGKAPIAPGTCGSLAAVIVAIPIASLGGAVAVAVAGVLASLIGIPTAGAAERAMNTKDPGSIVIDEVAGQWLALIPAGSDLSGWILAFFAFRLFDIWKPGPIGWADRRLGGGLGIMADDILAGIMAAGVVALAEPYLPATVRLF